MTAPGGKVSVDRALLRQVLERLGQNPASSEFGIVSQLRDAVAPRPEPEYAGRIPAEVRERHLLNVLARVLAHHLTERSAGRTVTGCSCGQLRLGESWAMHVAGHLRRSIWEEPLVQLPVDVQAAVMAAMGITLVAEQPQAGQDGDQVDGDQADVRPVWLQQAEEREARAAEHARIAARLRREAAAYRRDGAEDPQ